MGIMVSYRVMVKLIVGGSVTCLSVCGDKVTVIYQLTPHQHYGGLH